MNRMFLLFNLFVIVTTVKAEELESQIKAASPAESRSDPERGIFVKVKRYPDRMPNGSSGSHASRVEEEGGVKVLISINVTDTETVEQRIRLTEETLSHLITDEKEPDHLRWRAILNIDRAKLDPALMSDKDLREIRVRSSGNIRENFISPFDEKE